MGEDNYELFFEALANRLRMRILLATLRQPLNVKQIMEQTGEEQSKVSHALDSLRSCKLVSVSAQGRQRLYEANREILVPLLKLVDAHSCKMCQAGCEQQRRKEERLGRPYGSPS